MSSLLLLIAACSRPTAVAPTAADTASPAPADPTADTGAPWRCDRFEPLPEGGVLRVDDRVADTVEACGERLHPLVAPAGAAFVLEVHEWWGDSALTLELRDWNGARLARVDGLTTGATVPLTFVHSGEQALVVGSEDGRPGAYSLGVSCVSGCALQTTRYPVVWMHGMAGTDQFLDGLPYFYGLHERLGPLGYASHTPFVDPFRPTPDRAAQWAAHIDALVASGAARRVNLIGHSQGGLDARYVAAALDPERRVRSVTTIGSPHRGAAVADVAFGVADASALGGAIVDAAVDQLAALYGDRGDQDILAQLEQLTTESSAAFNDAILDRPDIPYASWAGHTCQLIDVLCIAAWDGEVVTPALSATHAVTALLQGDNDGLVSVESSKWGTYLGALPADHLDEVGLFPGTQAPGFDAAAFFQQEVERLAAAGL